MAKLGLLSDEVWGVLGLKLELPGYVTGVENAGHQVIYLCGVALDSADWPGESQHETGVAGFFRSVGFSHTVVQHNYDFSEQSRLAFLLSIFMEPG